jgi:hypothetical protein
MRAQHGRTTFRELYGQLAVARTAEGDFMGAARDYRSAHACRPHDPEILAALAGVLFDARDFAGARAAITASLAIDARSVSSNRLAGNLDFVAEHWADAIARFRYVAASDDDRVLAGYGQLMLWLAQRRAGVATPEFVVRTPGDGWPHLVAVHARRIHRSRLIVPIKQGDDADNLQPNTSSDERLCEALYYVGENIGRGDSSVARLLRGAGQHQGDLLRTRARACRSGKLRVDKWGHPCFQGRTCSLPRTMCRKVSCSTPTGPRA